MNFRLACSITVFASIVCVPAFAQRGGMINVPYNGVEIVKLLKGNALSCTAKSDSGSNDGLTSKFVVRAGKPHRSGSALVSSILCWGGDDLSVERKDGKITIDCGDDGRAILTLDDFTANPAAYSCKGGAKAKRILGTQFIGINEEEHYPYAGYPAQVSCCVR